MTWRLVAAAHVCELPDAEPFQHGTVIECTTTVMRDAREQLCGKRWRRFGGKAGFWSDDLSW